MAAARGADPPGLNGAKGGETARARCVATLALAALGTLGCGGAGGEPKHMLLITVDTLRADHLSSWGYGRPTSPAIDALAADGVRFTRAFAPRGMTVPSTVTLMTGRHPLETGVWANGDLLPDDAFTLAETLAANGFATGAFTTNQLLVRESRIDQGFTVFETRVGDDRDRLVVGELALWLREVADAERVFAWIHFMGPHMPYDAPPLAGRRFDFTDPAYAGPADGSREFLDAAYRDGRELDEADVAHAVALYDAEIARVDALVDLVLEAWTQTVGAGADDPLADTLVAFTADHGEELHQRHGYWAHSKSVYDSTLHVPLVLRHPRTLPAGVRGELVELQDVAPTLFDLLGVDPPATARGRSLLEPAGAAPSAFASWNDSIYTVRTDRWRLVFNPRGVEPDDPPEGPYPVPALALFDHDADPDELVDVSDEHPDVVRELRKELDRRLRALEVRAPSGEDTSEAYDQALNELGYTDEHGD